MRPDKSTISFLRSLARSTTGNELIRYLEEVERHYSDIRNLNGASSEARIEALKIFRESLLERLITLRSDGTSPPDSDEFT